MNIDEASKEMQVSKSTLRYWESAELIPKVAKNKSGYRVYSEKELNWIFYIKCLRKAGMPIGKLREFVNLYRSSSNKSKRKNLLIEQKNTLLKQKREVEKTLNYLSYKIDNFDTHMLNYEKEKLVYKQKIKI